MTGGPQATWRYTIQKAAPAAEALRPYFRLEESEGNVVLFLNQTFDLEQVYDLLQVQGCVPWVI